MILGKWSKLSKHLNHILFKKMFIVLLFICAYNACVISPSCPHPLPYHPLRPLSLSPTLLIPGRNYFALISNFIAFQYFYDIL
jgi:hypothetical protein